MGFVRIRLVQVLTALSLVLAIVAPLVPVPTAVLGQATSCDPEIEPNNIEGEAEERSGEFCFSGSLPESADQELVVWTVSEDDAKFVWSITVAGVTGTVTGAKIFGLNSEPGVRPIVAGNQLLDASTDPAGSESVSEQFLIAPGEYLLGISRSERADSLPVDDPTYEVALSRVERLPKRLDKEPNNVLAEARPIGDALAFAGDISETADFYTWTVDDAMAESGWELHLIAALGVSPGLVIRAEDGTPILYQSTDGTPRSDLYDLAFTPGTYTFEISGSYPGPSPYRIELVEAEPPVGDIEPNNEQAYASLIDPENPVITGRLASNSDFDLYRLVVDDNLAGSLFDLRVVTRSGIDRRICLSSVELGIDLKCAEGAGGATISNLLLPEGHYIIRVSGTTDPGDQYILRVDMTSPPSPTFETEPNDDLQFATVFDSSVVMNGQFNPSDYDMFEVTVAGEPQLWDLTATGTGILQVDYVRRDGTVLATADIAADQTSAVLNDLYLTPGNHWLRVRGDIGDYALTLTPMGAPPEDGEREANNTIYTAEPMLIGNQKTGRIPAIGDVDIFRFSLAAKEHIRIDFDVPDDASLRARVEWGRTRIGDATSSEPGEDLSFDLVLEPGDYLITLLAATPSLERYALNMTRLDPFARADDQEPNDTFQTAQLISPGQTVEGELPPGDQYDTYAVAAEDDRDLTFSFTGEVSAISLSDDQYNYYSMALNAEGTAYSIDQRASDDVPLYIQVSGTGPYTVTYGEVAPESGGIDLPGFLGNDDGADRSLEVTVALDVEEVAAYWWAAQSIAGVLTVTNTSTDSVSGTLLTTTTHFKFRATGASDTVEIGAGETIEIPVSVAIDPDAWANIPVRVSFGIDVNGLVTSTFIDITPSADALPVNPSVSWSVPEPLLGGLNVASPAFGGVPGGTVSASDELFLFDGVAPIGSGLNVSGPVLPLAIDVDLAGDEPVPLVGFLINNQTRDGAPQDQMRAFEFQTSLDGVNFTNAYSGEVGAMVQNYWFALNEPVEATHARLVILSTFADQPTSPSYVQIGEWSVIAEPGYIPEPVDEINIADWSLGGFVARAEPIPSSPDIWIGMLSPDGINQTYNGEYGSTFSWAVSFAENRAAQVTEIRWRDAVEALPENLIQSVTISISMGTPSGPWKTIGEWNLNRSDDGSVDPFAFEEGTWARYVRFEGRLAEDRYLIQLPEYLSIIEAPTSDEYRSITGEWGRTTPEGPYELLNPPSLDVFTDENDAPNTADEALEIQPGDSLAGRAQIGKDVDWYRVTGPDGDNQLTFTLTGNPTVDVVVRVYAESGDAVPVEREVVGSSATVVYRAQSEPGEVYLIEVEQPAHSIVFIFDTSASMGGYTPLVQQSLRSFANGIVEGQEFVQVMAFDADPLLEDFTDDSYLVYSAINGYFDVSLSSSGETGILDATELLATQEGSTAILTITDAETSSYAESAKMWATMDIVQPRVFAVHVAGSATPVLNEHLMQNWSSLGGFYQYTTNQSEMDRAFDRAATWLRRPAEYTLTVSSEMVEIATPTPEPTATPPTPGQLAVVSAETEDGEPAPAQVSEAVTIEIIFDTSGSMLAGMPDGQRRIDVAREVLTNLVTNELPPGIPVTLRVFGNTPESCDTSLLVPLSPLDPQAMVDTIRAIEPVNLVKTPIGASLEQVANDLAGVTGPKIVVLITDGEETCDGDPARAIQSLADQGIDVQVNIVGFALEDDDALRAQLGEWAALGNGTYFDATNSEELDEAIAKAVQAPYRVLDQNGNEIAAGTIDGNPVELPPGTYTVIVLTDPEQRFENVVVEQGETTELQMGP